MQVPLLVAIDSYEALYLPSGYGEWLHQHYRRPIQPHELRLAASLQVLQQPPPALGFVACADGNTCQMRSTVQVTALDTSNQWKLCPWLLFHYFASLGPTCKVHLCANCYVRLRLGLRMPLQV